MADHPPAKQRNRFAAVRLFFEILLAICAYWAGVSSHGLWHKQDTREAAAPSLPKTSPPKPAQPNSTKRNALFAWKDAGSGEYDEQKLAGLSDDDRLNAFHLLLSKQTQVELPVWLERIKTLFQGVHRQGAMGYLAEQILKVDRTQIWDLLARSPAGPQRMQVATECTEKLVGDDFTRFLEWSTQNLSSDELWGFSSKLALHVLSIDQTLRITAQLADQYQKDGFLSRVGHERATSGRFSEIGDLLPKLAPPQQFSLITGSLGGVASKKSNFSELDKALNFIGEAGFGSIQPLAARQAAGQLTARSAKEAQQWLGAHSGKLSAAIAGGLVDQWARDDLEAASGWTAALPTGPVKEAASAEIVRSLTQLGELDAAEKWIQTLAESDDKQLLRRLLDERKRPRAK